MDLDLVVEWKKKLRIVNEIYEKVKDDVDKLKEVSCSLGEESLLWLFLKFYNILSIFISINSYIFWFIIS